MNNVFISYRRGDEDYAAAIREKFEHVKGRKLVPELGPGEDWRERIRAAISDADSVVVLLSPGAAMSPWIGYELGLADAMEKRIVPVILGATEPADLPSDLAKVRVVDARGASSPQKVAAMVAEALGRPDAA